MVYTERKSTKKEIPETAKQKEKKRR